MLTGTTSLLPGRLFIPPSICHRKYLAWISLTKTAARNVRLFAGIIPKARLVKLVGLSKDLSAVSAKSLVASLAVLVRATAVAKGTCVAALRSRAETLAAPVLTTETIILTLYTALKRQKKAVIINGLESHE